MSVPIWEPYEIGDLGRFATSFYMHFDVMPSQKPWKMPLWWIRDESRFTQNNVSSGDRTTFYNNKYRIRMIDEKGEIWKFKMKISGIQTKSKNPKKSRKIPKNLKKSEKSQQNPEKSQKISFGF